MNIFDYNELEIAELIAITLRCDVVIEDGIVKYTIREREHLLPLSTIIAAMTSISTKAVNDETALLLRKRI